MKSLISFLKSASMVTAIVFLSTSAVIANTPYSQSKLAPPSDSKDQYKDELKVSETLKTKGKVSAYNRLSSHGKGAVDELVAHAASYYKLKPKSLDTLRDTLAAFALQELTAENASDVILKLGIEKAFAGVYVGTVVESRDGAQSNRVLPKELEYEALVREFLTTWQSPVARELSGHERDIAHVLAKYPDKADSYSRKLPLEIKLASWGIAKDWEAGPAGELARLYLPVSIREGYRMLLQDLIWDLRNWLKYPELVNGLNNNIEGIIQILIDNPIEGPNAKPNAYGVRQGQISQFMRTRDPLWKDFINGQQYCLTDIARLSFSQMKSFEGRDEPPGLRKLMANRFAAKQYGILSDPAVATTAGNLQTEADWKLVQNFYDEVLKGLKPEYRDGIHDKLRIIAMKDFPISGHHGSGGEGVGVNSAYIDWDVLREMTKSKEGTDYLACWLEHEYRERCLGEEHNALVAGDQRYRSAFAYIKTILHNSLRQRFAELYKDNTEFRPVAQFAGEPLLVKNRSEILAFSSALFADAQTFTELEVVLAELMLANNKEELWIKIADEKERDRFVPLVKQYSFLKVVNQDQYDVMLAAAKKKVIKTAFKGDATMGLLDVEVPQPAAGMAVNAFSLFLAAFAKDESIVKTVDRATLTAVIQEIEKTGFVSPVKDDYRKRLQEYRYSAVTLISA